MTSLSVAILIGSRGFIVGRRSRWPISRNVGDERLLFGLGPSLGRYFVDCEGLFRKGVVDNFRFDEDMDYVTIMPVFDTVKFCSNRGANCLGEKWVAHLRRSVTQ